MNVLRHPTTSVIPEIRRSTQHVKNMKEEMKPTTINLKALIIIVYLAASNHCVLD